MRSAAPPSHAFRRNGWKIAKAALDDWHCSEMQPDEVAFAATFRELATQPSLSLRCNVPGVALLSDVSSGRDILRRAVYKGRFFRTWIIYLERATPLT